MSDDTPAVCRFLPWARYGALASLGWKTVLGKRRPGSGVLVSEARVQVPIRLRLVGDRGADEVHVPLSLYGPGDVVGIDPREIVRTEPPHQTTDFPPHLFPFVEFDRPDFPWLFTPAGPDRDDCLRPWLVLVVVRKQAEGVSLTADPRKPLPVLRCPVSELPDLDESWAWAHGQYVGTGSGPLSGPDGLLNAQPHQNVSRLLCPRKLEPRWGGGAGGGYHACLVPAFEAGRKAGLGEPVEAADPLTNAWTLAHENGHVELPVYFHWEFDTGAEGSFEALVDRLQFLEKPPERDGEPTTRLMDMHRPFPDADLYPGATLGMASALYYAGERPAAWAASGEHPRRFEELQSRLRELLETGGRDSALPSPPPIYGRHHLDRDRVTAQDPDAGFDFGKAPKWLAELNLDPRYRVAAALGTRVIQDQQEQLVAAAWEQAAGLKAVNQWLRQKQLGCAVTDSVFQKRLAADLSDQAFWQITAPLAVAQTGGETAVPVTLAPDGVPGTAVRPRAALQSALISAPFRRLERALSPAVRRNASPALAAGAATPAGITAGSEAGAGKVGTRECAILTEIVPPPGATAGAVRVSGYPCGALPQSLPLRPDRAPLLAAIEPHRTFVREAQARLATPVGVARDTLQPFRFSPSFPQPMFEPLAKLFQASVVPSLDRVPHNSVLLMNGDQKFIESYMVGLNHEFSRELLWREFPTDLGSTYFRNFWDSSASVGAHEAPAPDMPGEGAQGIDLWNGSLGENLQRGTGSDLRVLLIRGDLLQRYPNAIIYAQKARISRSRPGAREPDDAEPGNVRFPAWRIDPVPGVTLLGFHLDGARAGSSAPAILPDWFFVFEEHPTETRFGLDEGPDAARSDGEPLTSWRELGWPDVRTRNGYVTYSESTIFHEQEIPGVISSLADTLRNDPDVGTKPVSDFVWASFEQGVRQALSDPGAAREQRAVTLVRALNTLLQAARSMNHPALQGWDCGTERVCWRRGTPAGRT